eukprot:1474872-Alexandrium_andersonii.AAC.1
MLRMRRCPCPTQPFCPGDRQSRSPSAIRPAPLHPDPTQTTRRQPKPKSWHESVSGAWTTFATVEFGVGEVTISRADIRHYAKPRPPASDRGWEDGQ